MNRERKVVVDFSLLVAAFIGVVLGFGLIVWLLLISLEPRPLLHGSIGSLYVVQYRAHPAAKPYWVMACYDQARCGRLAGGMEVVIGGRYQCAALTR